MSRQQSLQQKKENWPIKREYFDQLEAEYKKNEEILRVKEETT